MFVDYFGDTPRARILDFLGDHPTSDYNKTDLAAKSGLTRQTIYDALPALLGTGMVIQTRKVGQSQMYRLNTDHDVVRSVLSADMGQVALVAN